MYCKVKNCKSYNKGKASSISFFRFPSDKNMVKKWKNFCRRKESFNPKNAYICMKHFTSDDFENNMQFEMGFASFRFLKKGAMPSIYNPRDRSNLLAAVRTERIERRENKKIVDLLLHSNNDATIASHQGNNENDSLFVTTSMEELSNLYSENHKKELQTESIESRRQSFEFQVDAVSEDNVEQIRTLLKEIEDLRRENSSLERTKEKQRKEITALELSAIDKRRKHEFEIQILLERLKQADNELKSVEEQLLTVFTKCQIEELKTGIQRAH